MRSVTFYHPGGFQDASFRYRALIPAKYLKTQINQGDSEIVVISKPYILEPFAQMKEQGKTLVVDFCDDHFRHPKLGELYHSLCSLADYCVAPTKEMARRIPHKKVEVIPDPYEMPEMPPHADGNRLLWFGHRVNIKALGAYRDIPGLTIVTGPEVEPGQVPYSLDNLKSELSKANQALFPTWKGHEYKSPNRVINALRMGVFPICDYHPAYVEFKRFLWASDVRTGIKWVGEFKNDLNSLVAEGQEYIRDRYSPTTVGKQWESFLCSV